MSAGMNTVENGPHLLTRMCRLTYRLGAARSPATLVAGVALSRAIAPHPISRGRALVPAFPLECPLARGLAAVRVRYAGSWLLTCAALADLQAEAATLSVPQGNLLFCIVSKTEWKRAGHPMGPPSRF
jgi:hypothetical protein